MSQKFFKLVPDNPNLPFVKYSHIFFAFSAILSLSCIIFLFTHGLNYGVDFRGGTEAYIRFHTKPSIQEVRDALTPMGYTDAVVQSYGDANKGEYLIRVQSEDLQLKKYESTFQEELNTLADPAHPVRIRFSEDRIYATFDKPVEVERIKQAMNKTENQNVKIDSVSKFGRASISEYMIQFAGAGDKIVRGLKAKFGDSDIEVLQIDEVGQKVGGELRQQAIGAVLISMILILIYIWFRFDFEFAPGAILALVHDTSVILGVFALFQIPFDLSSIAAVLTVVGYSINDTIVTYDRVRENIRKTKSLGFEDIINLSINETLGRTILTTSTVLMSTLILYFMGGPITQGFALALTIGVFCGVYSTICMASPVTIYLRRYMQKRAA